MKREERRGEEKEDKAHLIQKKRKENEEVVHRNCDIYLEENGEASDKKNRRNGETKKRQCSS